MSEVTISSKYQIVVPRKAREALRLKPGAKLQFVVRGDMIILYRKPKNAARALAGISGGSFPPDYLDDERKSW